MGWPAGTRLRRWRRGGGLRSALGFVNGASQFLIVWIGAIQLAPTDALFAGFVQFWHDSAWLWLLGGVTVALISGAIRRHDPIPMDAANVILGEIQDALGEIFYSLEEAKVLTEQWRREYNTVRAHSACGGFPPAPEAIKPSPWFLRMPVLHGPPQVLGLT